MSNDLPTTIEGWLEEYKKPKSSLNVQLSDDRLTAQQKEIFRAVYNAIMPHIDLLLVQRIKPGHPDGWPPSILIPALQFVAIDMLTSCIRAEITNPLEYPTRAKQFGTTMTTALVVSVMNYIKDDLTNAV